MSAAETLQAAIDELEALKAESSPGPWEIEEPGEYFNPKWDDVRVMRAREGNEPDYDRYIIRDGSYAADAGGFSQPDAELIVTVHRTIDAQLAILRHDLEIRARYEREGIPLEAWESAVVRAGDLDLARAILGGDS